MDGATVALRQAQQLAKEGQLEPAVGPGSSATPTTIMLRKPYRVGWRKVGTLADEDVDAALTLLGSR